MADNDEEKKEDKGEHINLKVKDQDNAEVHFKVRTGTKFKKIFDAFMTRKALQPGSVRFLFDGTRIDAEKTPVDYDMEDGDSIDVMMEQVGGGAF
jgi:small ubiquitin-related modifier